MNEQFTIPDDVIAPPLAPEARKKRGPYKAATEKQTAAALLIGAGMTPEEAVSHVGYSPKSARGVLERIQEKGLAPFVTRKRAKVARNVVDAFMEGRAIGSAVPTATVTMAAANSVLDRAYPKVQDGPTTQNISFTVVNLNHAKPTFTDHQSPELVITPVSVSDNADI